MADLFRQIDERKEDYNTDVVVTFLEIYNEEIRDLLAEPGTPTPRGGLQIREDKSVKVVGLAELRPNSADEVKEIVLLGNSRRTQSPTHANETSSRSHAVLQVHVTLSPRTASLTETRTMATLSIIDLAGSERAAATSNMGQRMVEGANINKSLLALGNCINALCESGGAFRHIPYRNSKLTRLLKFSLGGNCKTVMIVCVAPTSANFDDTHNTLIYAERATKIKTKVITRNVVNIDRHVGQYVEAITRLNIQVEELKAQLAGKRDAEAEKEKRKKREAAAEVERAKNDLQEKADHTRAQIMDGAACSAKLDVAEAKLKVIRARLTQLDVQAATSPLNADLEAERGLLRTLAGPEELAIKPDSALRSHILRSGNSSAMFEATLRAVSERRSDKLDEVSIDNVKLDVRWRRAEMERMQAEARRDAMKEAVESQAEMVVNLVGLVGRCTVMLAAASRTLGTAMEDEEALAAAVKTIAQDLKKVADKNDEAFKALLGHSASEYAVGPSPSFGFDGFKSFPSSFGRRVASGPIQSQSAESKPSRRASSFGSAMGSSQLRKSYRSPRKSLRSSLVHSAPYRRASDKGKKKGVQWMDEVGQGDIDDRGVGLGITAPAISIIAPDTSLSPTNSPLFSEPGPSSGPPSTRKSPIPSESDWEDEKDENSLNLSFASGSRGHHLRLSASTPASESRVVSGKRPRASRLSPGFLKPNSGGSALGSLAETDEERSLPFRSAPLSDRNMNRATSPTASSSGSSTLKVSRAPKSPARRVPMTPKVVGSSKVGRRKSNIGPLRVERPRRRASMIPQLSPKFTASIGESASATSSGAQRVALPERSPAKRSKRLSSLSMPIASRQSSRLKASDTSISISADTSLKGGFRPTWR